MKNVIMLIVSIFTICVCCKAQYVNTSNCNFNYFTDTSKRYTNSGKSSNYIDHLDLDLIDHPDLYTDNAVNNNSATSIMSIRKFISTNENNIVPEFVKDVFIRPGQQKLDWTKTHPAFNRSMHYIALAAALSGTAIDGLSSHKYSEAVVKNLRTGSITKICEANKLFQSADGCGFRENKFFLIEGVAVVGVAEFIRPWFAAPADIIEFTLGIIGVRNGLAYRAIVKQNIIIK